MPYQLLLLLSGLLSCCLSLSLPAEPVSLESNGEVKVPLSNYRELLKRVEAKPREAPATYAIGKADVTVQVFTKQQRHSALVRIAFSVQTFDNEWTLVPLLSAATALELATVDNQAVQLVYSDEGFGWAVNKAGSYQVVLAYRADAVSSTDGLILPLVLPQTPAASLTADFPQGGVNASVVPGINPRLEEINGKTRLFAAIPATGAVQLSWKTQQAEAYLLSRAAYHGILEDNALRWTAAFTVEVFSNERLILPLLPQGVVLSEVLADGKPAVLLPAGKNPAVFYPQQQKAGQDAPADYFATLIEGQGQHEVLVHFEVPVSQTQGPPKAVLNLPQVPVSFFQLKLPGKKEVSVSPSASVKLQHSGSDDNETTQASAYIPLTSQVTFSWTEAVPEDIKDELRANASLFHAVHAEEGVLHGRVFVQYQITRGETNVLQLELPANTQINRIMAKTGSVTDWRTDESKAADDKIPRRVSVFLDRKVKGRFDFEVAYERLLNPEQKNFPVPLLRAAGVHRQRGMLALLSGPELVLKPLQTDHLSRVGENQLPADVRKALKMTVAHTYKYSGENPLLQAQAVAPERKRGKFDARTDTLISVSDVTLKGNATLELNVKSGTLMDLNLSLPVDVNVLGLSSPALRTYQVSNENGKQQIQVEFTQEIEGQFRLELNYERILAEGSEETAVPLVAVAGAEVEYGRIAVEALAAVEVQASSLEQLSSLDLNELPQQLVLKTTNPILLAYRYVRADTPYKLGLKITRHKELGVQVAAIEEATYHTLVTGDGLSVTTARYTIRNSRKQFLRLQLPPKAEVWSVFVGGKSEKPAEAESYPDSQDKRRSILIKMINSNAGFPLEIIYAAKLEKLGNFGKLRSVLPRPDMIATHSRWDLYLPEQFHYRDIQTNMDTLGGAQPPDPGVQAQFEQQLARSQKQGQSLRLNVPQRGVHFAFEKLYANQAGEDTWVEIAYVAADSRSSGMPLSLAGVILLGLGMLAAFGLLASIPRTIGFAAIFAGLSLILYAFLQLQAAAEPAVVLAFIFTAVLVVLQWRRKHANGEN